MGASAEPRIISPYGGELVNLLVPPDDAPRLLERANDYPSVQLSERAVCDLEVLATGGFSPLDRFMRQADYHSVLDRMRLTGGHVFPIPVTLPVDPGPGIESGNEIALRDSKNVLLATMVIEEVYRWEIDEAASKVFGTTDTRHPIVAEMHRWGKVNVAGKPQVIRLPEHFDFPELRLTPADTRVRLQEMGTPNVVAFQTRNPMHRVHEEMARRAIRGVDGVLLLHPVVGLTNPGDIDYVTRVRTYKALTANYFGAGEALLALLPLAMRMGGPREALWHALIRRNHGANHLIVGRDHAGPGLDSSGKPFYGPYHSQELVEQYSEELGVKAVPFRELVYLPREKRYEEVSKVPDGTPTYSISGTQQRTDYLQKGRQLPGWFTRPEIGKILMGSYPPQHMQGVCLWFTGLSGSGKSTTAEMLAARLIELGRRVTVLDGDVVRTNLSRGLGFSKKDRDANIRRIGFVAAEIVRHGGFVICAAVSPYKAVRDDVRNMVGAGNFVEVFVDTPLHVCEERDTKGMYAKARRGEIKNFTGIDDPYEPPDDPEITLETVESSADRNVQSILEHLAVGGFVRSETAEPETVP